MERINAPFTELVLGNLDKVERRMREAPPGTDPNLVVAIKQLLSSGGKRIRPTLTLLSGEMLGADPERIINLAAAIEMLHNATLVHDDLIDGALLRRGHPTLNAQWSSGATVLSGDFIFARAAYLAAETRSLELMRIFAEKLMVIVNGEIAQFFGTSSGNIRNDYFKRIYEKTASLFEVSAYGASLLSECDDEIRQEMKSFGYEVGMAFQIVDDILDFTGKQEKVGKPVGNDLRQGLLTLPAIRYFESHPEDPAKERILNGLSGWDDELDSTIRRITHSDAIDESFEEAEQFISSARDRLSRMPPNNKRDALIDLANYTIQRPF
jgi:octaprenyl-diphosphate synthase